MEMKPGYKQTEVGVIPKEWEVKRIGEFATVEGGYAFSSKTFLRNGKYQVIKMSNLYQGTLDLERSESYLNELDEEERHYLLKQDEILLTLTGTTGKRDFGYSYKINDEQNLLLNQRVGRLIVSEAGNPTYVAFQIETPCFLDQFFDVSKGGTGNQTNVGTQDVAAMRIPFPTLAEQRTIAGALSDVDALLGALDQLIAKKRDLKQAAMQQLLTAKKRLPGFGEEWRTERLGNAGIITMGQSPPGDSYSSNSSDMPLLNGAVDLTQDGIKVSQYTKTPTRVSKKDDLLFCIRATIGNLQIGDREYCLGRGVAALTVDAAYDAKFIEYQLKSLFALMNNQSEGGVIKGLRKDDVGKFTIFVPSQMAEQTAIAEVLTDMDAELAALEQRRAKTRALKQGMMQELLTGRIRLVVSGKLRADGK
jgi:type I restriction enzyme S subunit